MDEWPKLDLSKVSSVRKEVDDALLQLNRAAVNSDQALVIRIVSSIQRRIAEMEIFCNQNEDDERVVLLEKQKLRLRKTIQHISVENASLPTARNTSPRTTPTRATPSPIASTQNQNISYTHHQQSPPQQQQKLTTAQLNSSMASSSSSMAQPSKFSYSTMTPGNTTPQVPVAQSTHVFTGKGLQERETVQNVYAWEKKHGKTGGHQDGGGYLSNNMLESGLNARPQHSVNTMSASLTGHHNNPEDRDNVVVSKHPGSDNGVHLTMAAGNASHVSVHPPEPLEEATVHHTLFKPSQERAIYVGATPVAREVVNEEYDPEASQEPESEAPREISSYCDVQIVLSPAELKTFALRRHKLINDMKNRYKKSTLGVNVSDVNNGNGKGGGKNLMATGGADAILSSAVAQQAIASSSTSIQSSTPYIDPKRIQKTLLRSGSGKTQKGIRF